MNKLKKLEIIENLKGELKEYLKSNDKNNSYLIRFHRLYLDGSYGDLKNSFNGGENVYNLHKRKYCNKNLKEETLRSEGLATFRNFITIEYFDRKYFITNTETEYILKSVLNNEYNNFINILANNIKSFD